MDYRAGQLVETDVIKSKKGDKEAFGRLINDNKLSMYRISKSILKNEHDVEDAISNCILKAYTNLLKLRKNDTFKQWLFKILINECYSMLSRNKRELAVSDVSELDSTYEDRYPDFELARAVNSLDDDQRIVTVLFYYEDMCLRDISKALDLPEGTVKSRLSRAREQLRLIVKA